ncbi:MAG: hypothetical protein K2X11_06820 [Acetobacteraceae bacterium]|nr:hypothetical protein [Acetobacteraceae bacterium]
MFHPLSVARRMPPAVRFFVLHGLLGFVLSTLLTAAILWADPGGVARVLTGAAGHPWPLLLLWFFLGLTLGGVQSGAAVMLLGAPDRGDGGPRAPGRPLPAEARRPVKLDG